MTPEEIQKGLDDKFKGVNDIVQELAEQYKELSDNGASKEKLQEVHDSLKTQGETLTELAEKINQTNDESFDAQFKSFLDTNKEELDTIVRSKHGSIEFIPKAPEDITTASGVIVGTVPAYNDASLSNMALRNDNSLVSLCNTVKTSSASYPYTEVTPKDGDYSFVAEGALKPQIDFKWEVRYATPYKIAAHEILTEESVRDIPRLMSVAKNYLKQKHDLYKAKGVYFGTGVGENAEGATVAGRAFAAGGMATAVTNPNFMDVVNAIITDIYVTHNYQDETNYSPNVVLINPVDFFLELVSAKNADGLPLYPQASLFNSVNLGGITIRPWESIPSGKIFAADMRKYNLTSWVPYSIRLGWINDQFITNKFTMVGESRFHAFIKNLDRQAFVYDDIATIKTAITAP